MNPANTNALDPKLKEVYDRVMGTSVTPPAHPTAPITASPMTTPSQAHHPQPNGTASLPHQAPTPPANLPPLPPAKPRPATVTGAPQTQSAVDYAALAAKYATPPPPSFTSPTNQVQEPVAKAASVTPSTTTYGVVNGGTDKESKKDTAVKLEGEKGGKLKKIMLIAGVLMFLMIYTFVWIVVFGIELPF